MNENIVQIKGFTYHNGSYVKIPSNSAQKVVKQNDTKARKVKNNANVNKNLKG